MKTERVLEVMQRPDSDNTKLTITPTRITIKIQPNAPRYDADIVEAAKRIAQQIDYDYSLRGTFNWDTGEVRLVTKAKNKENRMDIRFNAYTGEQIL